MALSPRASKSGFSWIFRASLLLKVITAAAILAVLTELSLFRSTPLFFTLILSGIIIGFGLLIRNRYYLPLLRNLMLQGKLMLSPVTLLILTAPAAVIMIYYDLSGNESLRLLSALLVSLAAAFFLSSMTVATLPAMASVIHLAGEEGRIAGKHLSCDLVRTVIVISSVLTLFMIAASLATGFRISDYLFVFPLLAIGIMILDIIIVDHFRHCLARNLAEPPEEDGICEEHRPVTVSDDDFKSIMMPGDNHTDPARYNDLSRLPGTPEKSAMARSILLGRVRPHEQDVIKLLGDASPEIRRAGLMAAGRFDMTMLRNEVMKALDHPETAREAYHVLRKFGPDIYGDIIGTAIRPANTERLNYIIMMLLDAMPLTSSLPWLIAYVSAGHPGVRLKAASILCRRGWSPEGRHRQRVEETLSETVHTVGRIISLQTEAGRSRNFLLASALGNERKMNMKLISSLLSLLAGKAAAAVIMPYREADNACHSGIAAEAIAAVTGETLRRPLQALFGNSSDSDRLAELSLVYPIRFVRGRSLVSFLLSSEQNITGTWTKACALHKAATEGRGLDREQAVSYLFSNSQILQEESARAIKALNPEWYRETEARLPEPARSRIASVVNGTLPQTAMIFEKTRFLSLCFNNIPEEKMILLASGMSYSETFDATSLPGVISWVVPSKNGKTGLYSLPLSDIAGFVFHYSEYTDIFAQYTDTRGGMAVS